MEVADSQTRARALGTIEDTRLYSVGRWRKQQGDRAGAPGLKAWAGMGDKGSVATMTSLKVERASSFVGIAWAVTEEWD